MKVPVNAKPNVIIAATSYLEEEGLIGRFCFFYFV